MTHQFLANFMHFTKIITETERAMAFDLSLNLVDHSGFDEQDLAKPTVMQRCRYIVGVAIREKENKLTNNLFLKPEEAPDTNTNYANLHIVVAIPVPTLGAIYIDQHIRQGVIARDRTDRLYEFVKHLIKKNALNLSVDDMLRLYGEVT